VKERLVEHLRGQLKDLNELIFTIDSKDCCGIAGCKAIKWQLEALLEKALEGDFGDD